MKKLLLFIVLLTGVLFRAQDTIEQISAKINQDPQNAELYFQRGELYFSDANYDNAIIDYTKAIEINPNFGEAFFARGDCYYNQSNYDDALKDFFKTIVINPNHEFALNMIGVVYFYKENYNDAITYFNKAIAINNTNGLYYKNLGNSYRNLKNYNKALESYNTAIQSDTEDTEAVKNRAELYQYYLENRDAAIQDYTFLISKNPEITDYYRNRADLYADVKKIDLAEADYSKLISLNPTDDLAFIVRAYFYTTNEMYAKAIADYTQAIKLKPTEVNYYLDRASVYKNSGKKDLALIDLQKVINLDPNYTNAYSQRAFMNLDLENYESALKDFSKIIELEKTDYHYFDRANVYEKLKKYDLAEADFTSAVLLDSKNLLNRGMFYERIKKNDLAEADYKKAMENSDENSSASNYLANLYKNTGKFDKALEIYNNNISKNPQNPDVYISRAQFYYSQKKWDEGDADFNKAIQLKPDSERAYNIFAGELYQQRRFEKALEIINKLLKLNPTNIYTLKTRAQFYEAMHKTDLAEQDYNTIVNLSSTDEEKKEALQNRAFFYRFSHYYEKALKDYNTMIEMFPDDFDILENRSSVYEDMGKYELALEDINKIIRQKPNEVSGYNARSSIYQKMGKYNEALQDANFVISKDPKDLYNYRNRAQIYSEMGKLELAKQDYNKMIYLDENGYAYVERGRFYLGNNQFDLAFADYNTAIQKGLKNDGFMERGFANLWLGKYDEAKQDFDKMDDKENESSKIIITLPLNKLHLFEESNKYFKNFVENKLTAIDDSAQKTLDVFGISRYFTEKDYEKVIEIASKAQEDFKTEILKKDIVNKILETYLLSLKGYAYENLNKFSEAKQAYEQCLVINKNQPDVADGLKRVNENLNNLAKKDLNPPTIIILEPATRGIGIDADKKLQIIKGKVLHSSGIKSITINGNPVKFENDGFFETSVNLSEGENKFTIFAENNNGISAQKDLVLNASSQNQNITNIPLIPENPKYHAVLIAESFYQNPCLNDLQGPTKDMRKLYKVLTENYTFNKTDVDTLVNASRQKIVETLIKVGNKMNSNDNLLIFYAGHGKMITNEKGEKEGSLLPIDSDCKDLMKQITTEDLKSIFGNIKDAKHILFFADACFAGTIFRLSPDAPKSEQIQYNVMSRELMTSGNEQPVPDESNFVTMFVNSLQNNREKYITSERIFDGFKHDYRDKTGLIPQHRDIANIPGSEGGRFVFIRK